MTERRNTIVCAFETGAPKLTGYEIHEWIFEVLRLPEQQVLVIQIDGQQRKVYIKLTDQQAVTTLLGKVECKHSNGEITRVQLSEAGMGFRRIRVANLPPEEHEDVLRAALTSYGLVHEVKEEAWTNTYRYVVGSGVHYVSMTLTEHVPSNLLIKGTRVLITYDGQPITCYGCGEVGHMYNACPQRRAQKRDVRPRGPSTYAKVVSTNTQRAMNEVVKEPIFTHPQKSSLTVQETDKTGVDLWWGSDVELAPTSSCPEAAMVTVSTEGVILDTTRQPEKVLNSPDMSIEVGEKGMTDSLCTQHVAGSTQPPQPDPLLAAGMDTATAPDAQMGEMVEIDMGTAKQKLTSTAADNQQLLKRQKMTTKADKLFSLAKETGAVSTRSATTRLGNTRDVRH